MPDLAERSDGPRPPLPDHVTMPLLTLITQQSLDVDYQHVADRKARAEGPAGRSSLRPQSAAVIALFGLILAMAAVQTSRSSGVTEQSRASLIDQIETRRASVADLEKEAAALRGANAAIAAGFDALGGELQTVNAELSRLQVRTGFVRVHGKGVRITVDNGPAGDTGRVRDEDLALLADGLWSAGAEAISINGQRLTGLAGISLSGAAIIVNAQPISAPYTVLAIGDNSELQAKFAETTHGLQFYSLASTLGFDFHMFNEADVVIPGARTPVLRWATIPIIPDDVDGPGEGAGQAPSQNADTTDQRKKTASKGATP